MFLAAPIGLGIRRQAKKLSASISTGMNGAPKVRGDRSRREPITP
jgi:hypothetical protein